QVVDEARAKAREALAHLLPDDEDLLRGIVRLVGRPVALHHGHARAHVDLGEATTHENVRADAGLRERFVPEPISEPSFEMEGKEAAGVVLALGTAAESEASASSHGEVVEKRVIDAEEHASGANA